MENGDVFISIVKMLLIRLCLFVCVNLFFFVKCSIPQIRLCVTPSCQEPISEARGMVRYVPKEEHVLSFTPGQKITIISKGVKEDDYWGAIIDGKVGFVPPRNVQEMKVYHSLKTLKPVKVETNTGQPLNRENVTRESHPELSQSVEGVVNNLENLNTTQKPINPEKSFQVVEGTTIYEDITPSSTTDGSSTPQTVVPVSSDRAAVPPEVVEMNASYKGQNVVKSVEDSEEAVVKEEEDGEEDDEEDDDEEGEEGEDEEEEGDEEINKNFTPEEMIPSSTQSAPESLETVVNVVESSVTSQSSASVGTGTTQQQENVSVKDEVPMQGSPSSWAVLKGGRNNLPPPSVPPTNFEIENTTASIPTENTFVDQLQPLAAAVPASSEIKNEIPSVISQPSLSSLGELPSAQQQIPEPTTGTFSATPETLDEVQPVKQEKSETFSSVEVPTVQQEQSEPSVGTFSAAAQSLDEIPSAGSLSASAQSVDDKGSNFFGGPTEHFQPLASAVPPSDEAPESSFVPEQIKPLADVVPSSSQVKNEVPSVTPETGFVPSLEQLKPLASAVPSSSEIPSVPSETYSATAQSLPKTNTEYPETPGSLPTSQIPDAVTPKKVSENPTEAFDTTTQSIISKTSTLFDQFSVSADSPPEKLTEVEITTEALPPKVPDVTEGEKITTEGSILPEEPPTIVPEEVPLEYKPEGPGMMSQLTEMFSSWFTSPPKDYSSGEKEDFQEAFTSEAPSGTCENPESDFECKGSSSWTPWLPSAFGLDTMVSQSNTLVYLVVTAVTVLLFTLGHNFIEKRGVTGPLIAKINKLEHELLVTSKECLLLKDEIQSSKEKITLYENSANDELIVTLQGELEESKKIRAELESQIEVLQQELDAATEAGLDLNKMLSEVLTQKGGSDSLLKSVENLQAQLDSQQEVINEMTKKLGLKNQENEDLQSALDSANERSQNLEEELNDMKHNLNLHMQEKEELTKDLNTQINQLKTRIHQLGETKEKDIKKLKKETEGLQKKLSETSSALTVKEEEVKALKESMKVLKTGGDVKMETVFDVSKIKAELAKEVKENQTLLERLKKEETKNKELTEQVKSLEEKMEELKKKFEEAETKKDEAEKKLEVLSTYFKEKETQLQKELGLQEALWAQKKGDEKAVYNMMKSLQEEVDSYKSQNETLKKEILDQERALKSQMASYEQKAYENWVAARQAERKLEESKQEMAQLRNRLIMVEKNSSNAEGSNSLQEINGVDAASPILHDTSSPLLFPPLPLDPNVSPLLPPGFMPPPMFIPPPTGGFMPPPPFLPGDRRPPPLGRMSSPPLNNRFSPSSPADYPYERMSSPPLSPPGRLANEDREHYRHRTPPFPPPLHPRNWDNGNEIPGFIPISSQRDSRRDHRGSNISSEHSSSESLDKSSRHSGRV